MSVQDASPIRLSCRRLWKVFGEVASSQVPGSGEVDDPDGQVVRLKDAGLIPAMCDVSFDVRQREIFIIMGLSGSGKSTVVRCLSRLIEPSAGSVLIDGQELLQLNDRELIEMRRHKMGMVLQNFGLLPHLSVLDNVAYPLRVQGMNRSEREAKAREMVELVALGGTGERIPARAVRRNAATGGHRPLARGGTRHPVSRRALQRARSADPPPDAGRVPQASGRAAQDHRVHHARLSRSAAGGGSDRDPARGKAGSGR